MLPLQIEDALTSTQNPYYCEDDSTTMANAQGKVNNLKGYKCILNVITPK